MPPELEVVEIATPLGAMRLFAAASGVVALEFDDAGDRTAAWLARRYPGVAMTPRRSDRLGAAKRLLGYFAGDLEAIEAIPVEASGTDFQRRVWGALREIPVGTTWSYQQLAGRVGKPEAVRAVGAANGANPVAIVVPCHRVIAKDGKLHGYGGGLRRKDWLLRHEKALLA